jgi:hypothetical protein
MLVKPEDATQPDRYTPALQVPDGPRAAVAHLLLSDPKLFLR